MAARSRTHRMLMQSTEDGTMGIARCCCDPEAKSGEFYGPLGKGLQQAQGIHA